MNVKATLSAFYTYFRIVLTLLLIDACGRPQSEEELRECPWAWLIAWAAKDF